MLPKPCVAPRSEVSGAGEVPTGTRSMYILAQVAAAVAHLLLREIDHAALVVDRVELRVLLVAEHHRMCRRGLRRRVPHAQHRVVRLALVGVRVGGDVVAQGVHLFIDR
jgi:hypothetical protein